MRNRGLRFSKIIVGILFIGSNTLVWSLDEKKLLPLLRNEKFKTYVKGSSDGAFLPYTEGTLQFGVGSHTISSKMTETYYDRYGNLIPSETVTDKLEYTRAEGYPIIKRESEWRSEGLDVYFKTKLEASKDEKGQPKFTWMRQSKDSNTTESVFDSNFDPNFKPNLENEFLVNLWAQENPKIGDKKVLTYSSPIDRYTTDDEPLPQKMPYKRIIKVEEILPDPDRPNGKIYKFKDITYQPLEKNYDKYFFYVDERGFNRMFVSPSGGTETITTYPNNGSPPFNFTQSTGPKKKPLLIHISDSIPEDSKNIKLEVTVTGKGHEHIQAGPHQKIIHLQDKSIIHTGNDIEPITVPQIASSDEIVNEKDSELNADLSKKVDSAIGNEKSLPKIAVLIASVLNQNIHYCTAFQDTDLTLEESQEHGFGDCTDFSKLEAAFARKKGIPARVARGVVLTGKELQGHNWTELLIDGKWQAFEPQTGQFIEGGENYFRLSTHPTGDNKAWQVGKELNYTIKLKKEDNDRVDVEALKKYLQSLMQPH